MNSDFLRIIAAGNWLFLSLAIEQKQTQLLLLFRNHFAAAQMISQQSKPMMTFQCKKKTKIQQKWKKTGKKCGLTNFGHKHTSLQSDSHVFLNRLQLTHLLSALSRICLLIFNGLIVYLLRMSNSVGFDSFTQLQLN